MPWSTLRRTALSEYMLGGRVVHKELLEELYAEHNAKYGSNFKLP